MNILKEPCSISRETPHLASIGRVDPPGLSREHLGPEFVVLEGLPDNGIIVVGSVGPCLVSVCDAMGVIVLTFLTGVIFFGDPLESGGVFRSAVAGRVHLLA